MRKNREMIISIIEQSNNHPTAEEIFLKAKDISPKIVLATVYNNLNKLVEEGLIHRLSLVGGPDRYDRIVRHDHLICDRCGKLSDIILEDLSSRIEEEVGGAILSYDLKIHYICEDCNNQK